MNDLDNLWAAEYSQSQDAFNVDTVGQILRTNTRLVLTQENNDYLIFGIFDSAEEANAACDEMKAKQKQLCTCPW
jgi:hypothetical protein